jgi:hypothetical protein
MANESPNWPELKQRFGEELVEALERRFKDGPFEIRASQLAAEAHSKPDVATNLLGKLVTGKFLSAEQRWVCPCADGKSLTAVEAKQQSCAHCDQAFEDRGGEPEEQTWFVRHATRTRDVPWVLALHGMNTLGPWQEQLNWLVARTYGRSVPVAIYKYGVVRPGAVLKFRIRELRDGLIVRIRALSDETKAAGFGGKPDVIAHSLGTLLLGQALQTDSKLEVGRMILTGCILPPDFDWQSLIDRGQVEAVLCHAATGDGWARIAPYLIPGSGPAGVRGFNDRKLAHWVIQGGAHSYVFEKDQLPKCFEEVWQPFLTQARGEFVSKLDGLPEPPWKPPLWLFRARLWRFVALGIAAGLLGIVVVALVLGLRDLFVAKGY